MKSSFFQKSLVQVLVIAAVGFLAYSNTFDVPFYFDDEWSIIENPGIRNLSNFFTAAGFSSNPRRFAGYLTIALNYRLGGLDVTGYHIFNLAVHITSALLVYALVRLTFRTPFFAGTRSEARGTRHEERGASISGFSNLEPRTSNLVPLLAALLFVAHPVQTQAVTYIVQRLASLATMFYLLSLVFYAKARLASSHQSPVTSHQSPQMVSLLCYLGAIAAAMLAMITKEIAFTLPFVVALYELSFFRTTARKKLFFVLPAALAVIIVPVILWYGGKPFGELLADLNEKTRYVSPLSRSDYLLTQFSVIATYIRLLFLPVNQNLDYDYPIYHSLLTPRVFLSLLFLLALAGLAVWLFYRSRPTVNQSPVTSHQSPVTAFRLVSFGIFWFFITLSVESSIIPITDVIFEHRLYLPSVGFFMALAAAVFCLKERLAASRPALGRALVPVMAAVVLLHSGATYARNDVWRDPGRLWEDTASKSPMKARPHNNLGLVYGKNGRIEDAVRELTTAVILKPDYAEAYNYLGYYYFQQGRLADAVQLYKTAISLVPGYAVAHCNLAVAYAQQGLFEEAVQELQTAIRLKPDYELARQNLELAQAILKKNKLIDVQ